RDGNNRRQVYQGIRLSTEEDEADISTETEIRAAAVDELFARKPGARPDDPNDFYFNREDDDGAARPAAPEAPQDAKASSRQARRAGKINGGNSAPIAAWEMDELKTRGFTPDDLFAMSPERARAILADPESNKLTETYGKGDDAPPDTLCRVCKQPGARLFSEPRDPLAGQREDYVGGGSYALHLACCPRFFKSGMPMED